MNIHLSFISRRSFGPRLVLMTAMAFSQVLAHAAQPTDARPEQYEVKIPIRLAADSALQRLPLPAAALAALHTVDYRDLRIFDASGLPVPMALIGPPVMADAPHRIALTAYPILAPASAEASSMNGSLSLTINEQQGHRTVSLQTLNGAAVTPEPAQKTIGALFDMDDAKDGDNGPIDGIVLDADLPIGQPIRFDIETSRDLSSWMRLGTGVRYRKNAGETQIPVISLSDTPYRQTKNERYLRVMWRNQDGNNVPQLALRGAIVVTGGAPQATQHVAVDIGLPPLRDPHELWFSLPFSTPLAGFSLKLTPQSGDTALLPVTIFGRNDHNDHWLQLASSVVYSMNTGGLVQHHDAIDLPDVSFREWKILADPHTPGFNGVPMLSARFARRQIVFLTSSTPPYTLVAGLEAATPEYGNASLPIQNLIPGYRKGQENTVPMASVDTAIGAPIVDAIALTDGPTRRVFVLWGVLLAAVALLGAMAWMLLKKPGRKPAA